MAPQKQAPGEGVAVGPAGGESATNGAEASAAPAPKTTRKKGRRKAVAGAKRAVVPPAKGPDATATIYPGKGGSLPSGLVQSVRALERALKMPVWLLLQGRDANGYELLGHEVLHAFEAHRGELKSGERIALLVDSPGGLAPCAYKIARLLRVQSGGFTAIIPRYAKSAATLLSLAADPIVLARHAELGPLDAQLLDHEDEELRSALDEVQALERLHAFALEAVDKTMILFGSRTGKKAGTLLPSAIRFTADLMRPLFEDCKAVHYTQMSRLLKVAEEYAIRLLQPKYDEVTAKKIARSLVHNYPEHGFVIDNREAASIGLATALPANGIEQILDSMAPYLGTVTAIGRMREVV